MFSTKWRDVNKAIG